MLGRFVRYTLLEPDGEIALVNHHFSNDETLLVSDSLGGLISYAAKWADLSDDDFLKELLPGGSFAEYRIVREEIERVDLNEADLVELQGLYDVM